MIMSSKVDLRIILGVALCSILVAGSFITSALAANTNSLDLESSSSQYASISDGSQTGLSMTSDFSISFWMKLENINLLQSLIGKWGDGTDTQSEYRIWVDTDNKIYLSWKDQPSGADRTTVSTNSTLIGDTWYHITATVDVDAGAPGVAIYVNGLSQGTAVIHNNATSLHDGSGPFWIGYNSELNGYLDGKIDDVRVWGRLLSLSEVNELYNEPETFLNGSNLVGWWEI